MAASATRPHLLDDGATRFVVARRLGRELVRNRLALTGIIILAAVLFVSVAAPLLTPYGYAQLDLSHQLAGPSTRHPLGTDNFGRDVWSRLLYGGRVSLFVSVAPVATALVVGAMVGSTAALVGGWLDEILMRVMDLILAFPYIVLAITLVVVLRPGLVTVIVVITTILIPQFARVTRGAALVIVQQEYVVAARTFSQGPLTIIFRHVLPNVLTPLIVVASLSLGSAMLIEAALSFLGLGIQPPMSSWGTMIFDGTRFLNDAPWEALFPGIMLTVAVLSVNLIGDGLRDALDPRLRRITSPQ